MTKLTIPDVAIARHKESYSDPLEAILSRLAKAKKGRVFVRTKNQDGKSRDDLCELLGSVNSSQLKYLKQLYKFHKKEDILCATGAKLLKLVRSLDIQAVEKDEQNKPFFSALAKIFSYDGFRESKKLIVVPIGGTNDICFHWGSKGVTKWRSWGAGRFIKALGVKYCPYCNADSVYSSFFWGEDEEAGDWSIQSELDHFMPKNRYPFLAISLYNLVPSCRRCNGSIKGGEDIAFDDCLYPYVDSLHDAIEFAYDPSCVEDFYCVGDDRNPALTVRCRSSDARQIAKTRKFLRYFKTKEVYQHLFADEILNKYHKAQRCSLLLKDVIRRFEPQITERGIKEFVLHHSLDASKISEERFSKVFIDLMRHDVESNGGKWV